MANLKINRIIAGLILSLGLCSPGLARATASTCAAVVMQDTPGVVSKGESISHRYGYRGGPGNSSAQAMADAAREAATKCYGDPARASQDAETAENQLACELTAIAGCQCHFDYTVDSKACNLTYTNYENDGTGGIRKCVVTTDPATGRQSPCMPAPITAGSPVPDDVKKKLNDRHVQGTWQVSAEGYYDATGYSCSDKGICEEGTNPVEVFPGGF